MLDIRCPRFSESYQKLLWLTTRCYWFVFLDPVETEVYLLLVRNHTELTFPESLLSPWLHLAWLCFHRWSKTVGETVDSLAVLSLMHWWCWTCPIVSSSLSSRTSLLYGKEGAVCFGFKGHGCKTAVLVPRRCLWKRLGKWLQPVKSV